MIGSKSGRRMVTRAPEGIGWRLAVKAGVRAWGEDGRGAGVGG